MSVPFIVAIDGPAGSGKSSVSKAIAERLSYRFLDTGSIYRALTWWVIENNVDAENPDAVFGAAESLELDLVTDPHNFRIRVNDGHDITEAIRGAVVTQLVSTVAKHPAVRQRLTELYRSLVLRDKNVPVIAEGRDLTTVVFPHAQVRILLTASEAVRMKRRSAQSQDTHNTFSEKHITERDAKDSRVVNFTTAAEGVATIDSTHLTFDETVETVVSLISSNADFCGDKEKSNT